jgi:kinesin family protein 5
MSTPFILDSIKDVVRGFNSTIFAYGQTGSGKTYTMFGPHWEDNFGYQNTMGSISHGNFLTDSNKFGIIPKSIEEIFNELSLKDPELGFTVYCSFL